MNAINLFAEAHKSDPFAASRMALHLSRGYERDKKVVEGAERIINSRRADVRRNGNVFSEALRDLRDMMRYEEERAAKPKKSRRGKKARKNFAPMKEAA